MAGKGLPKWTMRIDAELRAKVNAKAAEVGRPAAEVVREFLENWVKD